MHTLCGAAAPSSLAAEPAAAPDGRVKSQTAAGEPRRWADGTPYGVCQSIWSRSGMQHEDPSLDSGTIEGRTLRSHREALARNPMAYTTDLPRVRQTAVHHLKKCGFLRVYERSLPIGRRPLRRCHLQYTGPTTVLPRGQSPSVLLERAEGLGQRLHSIRVGPPLFTESE